MEPIKVTVTNDVSANNVEYNVNNLNELINELNKIGKLFYLMYENAKIFNSLENIIYDHELKDNYTIVYLDYDEDLIFRIKAMKDDYDDNYDTYGNYKYIDTDIEYISLLCKKRKLYDDPIFVVFLAINIPWCIDLQWFSLTSDYIKNNSEVMIKLMRINSTYLKYASECLKNNKEFVLNAVKYDGCFLKHVSKDLKNDKEIVLVAVKNYGYALEYASEDLKNNKEIVSMALKRYRGALEYASKELQNDEKFLLLIK
jgi:hypothetical protein